MTERRSALIAAAIVFAATLAVYGSMLPTGVATGDEGEAQTVPYILGIMHPTGFPAYTLAGWIFSHAIPLSTIAWRMNAFSAVFTAAGAAGVVLLAVAIGSSIAGAVCAALTFAFGSAIWGSAINANAQVLALPLSIYALLAAVIFARSGDARALIAACACGGLALATHPVSVWILPAIAVALLWRIKTTTKRALAAGLVALALPLLLYAYLPLRSTIIASPDTVGGTPSLSPVSLDWEATPARTLDAFLAKVLGRGEGAPSSVARALDPRTIPDAAQSWLHTAGRQYTLWLLVIAAAGFAALAVSDLRTLSVLAAGTLGGVAFAYAYRLDPNLDRYYAVSLAVTAAIAAASTRIVVPRLPANAVGVAATVALGVVALVAAARNRPIPQPQPSNGEAIIAAVRRDTPDNAIVIAAWNEATALRYGAFVEHALASRTIVAAQVGQYAGSYPLWMRERPVILYAGPASLDDLIVLNLRVRRLPTSLPPYGVLEVLPEPRPER